MHSSTINQARQCVVVTRDTRGQPRTLKVTSTVTHAPAYRRLAVALLRLDVATLAGELRSARLAAALVDSPARTHIVRAA